jgi:glycosyltransferase involved in cell wall biosynthesis
MEVRDLWPESIKGVGAMENNIFIKYLEWEELRCYKKANGIVSVTESFKNFIIQKGISHEKIKVVKNGIDPSHFVPKEKNHEILNSSDLSDKFIIGYIGTHGMAHKLDFIIQSASKIKEDNIHFLFIGDGAEKQNVMNLANDLNMINVTFLDPVPKEKIQDYIASIDVALVPLKKSDLFKTVIPSKIFENAAMLKPILLGVDGESREIIEKYQAGLYYEPENEKDFIEKVKTFYSDKQLYENCQKGCQKLAKDFNRKKLAKEMLEFMLELGNHKVYNV